MKIIQSLLKLVLSLQFKFTTLKRLRLKRFKFNIEIHRQKGSDHIRKILYLVIIRKF